MILFIKVLVIQLEEAYVLPSTIEFIWIQVLLDPMMSINEGFTVCKHILNKCLFIFKEIPQIH